jgi:predicted ribosomally synthesized peptide with nif11-like leader
MTWPLSAVRPMSEEQLSALLAKFNDDAELQERLKGAADFDVAVAMIKEAGFGALLDVSKEDWLKYQANQAVELSDEELGNVSGGYLNTFVNALIAAGGFSVGAGNGMGWLLFSPASAAEIAQKIGR